MDTAGAKRTIKRFVDAASAVAVVVRRLASPAWKALTFSPSEALAPDSCLCARIGRGCIEIVHATRVLSKYRIKAYKTYQYCDEDSIPSPEETASALAVSLKDFGIRKAKVVLVIPKAWVVVKSASLPAAAGENLREVVTYEFDRFTPFSADEALYDYLVEKITKDKIDLLIAALKASTVAEYNNKLLDRGITVRSVALDLSCLATLCRFITGLDSFIFVEIGRNGCGGGVVHGGILKAASAQDFQKFDDQHRAEGVEEFITMQQKFFDGISKEVPVLISFGEDKEFGEVLLQRGRVSFKPIEGSDKEISGLSKFKGISDSLTGAAIEHLWPGARGFNLLSKGLRGRVKMPFLLTSILAFGIVACIGAYLFIPIQTETDRLAEIDRQINSRKDEIRYIEKIKSEIEATNKQIALINNFKHGKPFYMDMMKELTQVVPKNSWLTRVRIAGSQVNIEGYAPSATSLIQLLEASKYFEKVEFSSPTFRDARQNMDRFQIKADIKELKPEGAVHEKK